MKYRFYMEPQSGYKPIVDFIRNSKKFLYMNYYLIDDKNIIEEIKNKAKTDIDLRIIVDGRPYGINGSDGTEDEIKLLRDTGARVKIAPARFEKPNVFDHAKYMVTDNAGNIGTLNLTEAAFKKNREYGVITTEKNVIESLKDVFLSDWENKDAGEVSGDNLIISPGSGNDIRDFISRQKKVKVETEEMGDDDEVLNEFKKLGKKVKIIVPASVSSTDVKNLKELSKSGVKIKYMNPEKIYIHAKAIIGAKEVFIGSENFTKSSLNKNREIGIIIKKHQIISRIRDKFDRDWKKANKNLNKVRGKKTLAKKSQESQTD